MTIEQFRLDDPRIQAAANELECLIRAGYPEASFDIFIGEDPEGVYLRATVDVEELDDVYGIVVDRLLEFQVEERLPIYVATVRPLKRVVARLEAERERQILPATPPIA